MSWLVALARTLDPRRLQALAQVHVATCAAVLAAALFLGGADGAVEAGARGHGYAAAGPVGVPCAVEPNGAGAASYGDDAPRY